MASSSRTPLPLPTDNNADKVNGAARKVGRRLPDSGARQLIRVEDPTTCQHRADQQIPGGQLED
eukprot:7938414-Prorocentrum_lima.AAC.1